MRRDEFKAWLEGQGFGKGSASSRTSNCSWIEKSMTKMDPAFEGLDAAFDVDGCSSLMRFLEYHGEGHPLAPLIGKGEADIKNNLSTYRTALRLYVEFRQGVVHDRPESAARRPAAAGIAGVQGTVRGNVLPLPDDCGPIASLWKRYCEAREALTSALGRTSNVLGEIAERAVADYHGGKLLTASAASADVELDDGTLIQVKARIPRQGMTTSLSAIRSWGFDRLAVLLFNDSGSILFAGEMDVDAVMGHAAEVPHTNSWNVTTTDAFLGDPRMVDLTDEYNAVLAML